MHVRSTNRSRFSSSIFRVGVMFERRISRLFATLTTAILLPLALITSANALGMKECSVKYKAAQSAGEAQGVSWSEFRKAQCTTPADAVDKSTNSAPTEASAKTTGDEPKQTAKNADATAKPASGKTTFPSSIAAKFAAEKPAKARMHTCLEQYHANKKGGTLGGTRWIEKGGGYYKLCNARLKGGG
jgi:N-acetylmuramoyl-L-alanine amidase CwlA